MVNLAGSTSPWSSPRLYTSTYTREYSYNHCKFLLSTECRKRKIGEDNHEYSGRINSSVKKRD